jgi:transcription elongation factor GreA
MTKDGYDKLKEKLNYLMKTKRKEIAKNLEIARAHGDLRENAEYSAAKEQQSLNELKIVELAEKLTYARVIDEANIPKDKAYLGATVKILDMKLNEESEYTLVSEAEADILENKISVTSPIGKGLLGCKENEIVNIQVPAGLMEYKILKIVR